MNSTPNRPWYKKKRFLLPGAVVALFLVLQVSPDQQVASSPIAPKSVAPEAISVKAKTILDEFRDNEAAADAKYDGKVLRVTGVIDKIDTEFLNEDEYVIRIGEGGDFVTWTVNADDQKQSDVANLKKGQEVTVQGEFEDGGDLGIELTQAKIVG